MQLFRMLWLEERSIEETSGLLGMTREAVYAWRFRVRKIAKELREEVALAGACTGPLRHGQLRAAQGA